MPFPAGFRFAAMLAAVLSLAAAVPLASAQDKLPVEEVERIVREYLLREPEVVYQAIQELQKRREAEEAARQKQLIAQHADEILHEAADPVAGNPAGDVTLVEFFDYRCGYCRSMSPALRGLIEKDGKLRFVFKELPVLGPESVTAARAALAASRQNPGRYPAFHFALMQAKDLGREAVLDLAARHGFDPDRLAAEMDGAWVEARIKANLALADTLGIQGTPSFIVGDQLIPGATEIAHLAELIGAQRRAGN